MEMGLAVMTTASRNDGANRKNQEINYAKQFQMGSSIGKIKVQTKYIQMMRLCHTRTKDNFR